MKSKAKILFLVSGGGGNLQFVYHAIKQLNFNIEICGVIADRNCNALQFAVQKNIPSQQISYSINCTNELTNAIEFYKPSIVITTFHKIIKEEILIKFSNIRFINLHYSVLPNFKNVIGMKAIEMAKTLNHNSIGATAHVVEKEVDAGKTICQGKIKIDNWNNENSKTIIDAVFKTGCIVLLNAILAELETIQSAKNLMYNLNQKDVLIENDLINTKATANELLDIFALVKPI
jgi:phosphoribosylglycinamide formyltransferase-1